MEDALSFLFAVTTLWSMDAIDYMSKVGIIELEVKLVKGVAKGPLHEIGISPRSQAMLCQHLRGVGDDDVWRSEIGNMSAEESMKERYYQLIVCMVDLGIWPWAKAASFEDSVKNYDSSSKAAAYCDLGCLCSTKLGSPEQVRR